MRFAPGGRRYALLPLLLTLPLAVVSIPVAALSLAVGLSVLAFYRDPSRVPPEEGIVAPADGRVTVRRREGDRLRVGVFMNVTDVHVVRAPLADETVDVIHEPGAHRPAFSKSSDRNERVRIQGTRAEVVLIAGAFARRITPYVGPGGRVERGERVGHIAFGSRVDVLLPPSVGRDDLTVERGDRVSAGETVIASEPEPNR